MTHEEELDLVFGPGDGTDLIVRARRSGKMFVRSIDQVAEPTPSATGHKLTAAEALEAYGYDILRQVTYEGSAPNPHMRMVGTVLRQRRADLGLEIETIARATKQTNEMVLAVEAGKRRPVRVYEKVARMLGLNDSKIGIAPADPNSNGIAVRLRSLSSDEKVLSAKAVVRMSEAAWVASKQSDLLNLLGFKSTPDIALPQPIRYGQPPYVDGYALAVEARKKLGIADQVESMRELIENKLGVPLIQTDLDDNIAGATILVGTVRAIVLNMSGENHNALTRRMTMAHEVCHLLFDPEVHLNNLVVDEFESIGASVGSDVYEQRANAFAAEFLAPRDMVARRFTEGLEDTGFAPVVEHFGIGTTVALHQLQNYGKDVAHARIDQRKLGEAVRYWEGVEDYTQAYHPIPGLRPARAGKFSALVIRAWDEKLISDDSAGEYLECDVTTLRECVGAMKETFPEVFQ